MPSPVRHVGVRRIHRALDNRNPIAAIVLQLSHVADTIITDTIGKDFPSRPHSNIILPPSRLEPSLLEQRTLRARERLRKVSFYVTLILKYFQQPLPTALTRLPFLVRYSRRSATTMATMIPSPEVSPIMGASHRIDRQQSNSPHLQEQQLSKRDKRRTGLANRLAEITAQFSDNRDVHYRNQLQALQIDINLIGEADAHGDMPLPDSAEAIERLVRDNLQKTLMKAIGANVPLRAGRVYADFAKEINDAMEEKDTLLAMHKVRLL